MMSFRGICVVLFLGIFAVGGYFSRQEMRQIDYAEIQGRQRLERVPASKQLFEDVTVEDAGNSYQRILDRRHKIICYAIKANASSISCVPMAP
ncbi:MAG: hypothetical protein H7222_09250 [Methylotenera sp.]|nr:hypothetical protein [Oligoflexia bacterium]